MPYCFFSTAPFFIPTSTLSPLLSPSSQRQPIAECGELHLTAKARVASDGAQAVVLLFASRLLVLASLDAPVDGAKHRLIFSHALARVAVRCAFPPLRPGDALALLANRTSTSGLWPRASEPFPFLLPSAESC